MKIHKFIIIFAAVVVIAGGFLFVRQTQAATVAELQTQIQQLLAQIQQLQNQITEIQGQPAQPQAIPQGIFTRNLAIGSQGNDVKALQQFLKDQGSAIYPEGLVTGYFGSLTQKALSKYQKALGITKISDASGNFGPLTRAFLANPKMLHRISRNCSDDSVIKEETFKVGGDTGYWNFTCQNGKQKQCYDDGTFDTYYDEWCQDVETSTSQPPVISGVGGPTTLKVGESGTWTIKAYDPENGYLSYSVDWGDTAPLGLNKTAPSTPEPQTVTFTHSYSKAGTYTVRIVITDDQNLSAKTSITVKVGETTSPSITVISPNGGEKWEIGKTYQIKLFCKEDAPRYTINFYLVNVRTGNKRNIFGDTVTCRLGSVSGYDWTIPTDILPTDIPGENSFKLRAEMTSGNVYDESDNPFSIVAATSTVFSCGDVTKDGVINAADIVYLTNYRTINGPAPDQSIADVNADGVISKLDEDYLTQYLYKGGAAPLCSSPKAMTCGDIIRDGVINQLDINALTAYLYQGGPAPSDLKMADVNSDGKVNASDVVYLTNYLSIGGPAPKCPAPLPNSVLWLKFDEASGSTAFDSSGKGNNGSIEKAIRTTGYKGYGLRFDDVDARVKLTKADPDFEITQKLTISAWIKFEKNLNPLYNYLVYKDHAYGLRFDGNMLRALIYYQEFTATDLSTTKIWDLGKWYHITFTYDGNVMKLYINGVLDSSKSLVKTIHSSPNNGLSIGNYYDTGQAGIDYPFPGIIDEVRIYNTALSEGEVKSLVIASLPVPSLTASVLESFQSQVSEILEKIKSIGEQLQQIR